MAYTSTDDILAEISQQDLIAMLNDNGLPTPTLADVQPRLDAIISRESAKIDGRLATIYPTPFNPVPAAVRDACTLFVCEALYRRRLTPDEQNPFHIEAEAMRERLKKVGANEELLDLDLGFPRAFQQGAYITTPVVFNGNTL